MACALLGQNVMVTAALSHEDRLTVLRFASAFLWADLELAEAEEAFLHDLADELAVARDPALLERPPLPEEVDPSGLSPQVAALVRDVVLRAIAADGRVDRLELALFDLLDELLVDHEVGST